jgi:hypothetical protein
MVEAAGIVLWLTFSGTFVGGDELRGGPDPAPYPQWLHRARPAAGRAATEDAESPSSTALRFFEALPPEDALRAVRPARVAGHERTRLLAMLPEEGELTPDGAEQRKLAALAPVLAYHDRQGAFEIKVIDLPQAGLVMYERAALLVSRPALRLLSASELQAAVAHEIGHEYFWSEYGDPSLAPSAAARQAVELKCDGIAALTLLALGLDVSHLTAAMKKIVELNGASGATPHAIGYPTPNERERFVRALLKMRAAPRR